QHRLALFGDHSQDPFDVGEEPEVEHLVGLVQDQARDLAEDQVTSLGEVEQSARSADHHVDSRSQGFDLWLVRSAAVDRRGAYTEVLAGFGDVLGDLLAQFAGRYDHQYLWGSVTGKLQPVQQ